jgi:hypothetical protein
VGRRGRGCVGGGAFGRRRENYDIFVIFVFLFWSFVSS